LLIAAYVDSPSYGAGGLQTGAMIFAKGYLASVLCYSGGGRFESGKLPDPSNVPSMIGAYGPAGTDTFMGMFDGGQSTLSLEKTLKGLGGFVIGCQDTGDHVNGFMTQRTAVGPAAWQFFKDRPFRNSKPMPKVFRRRRNFPTTARSLINNRSREIDQQTPFA
jgi:hypothetical protein